MNGNYFVIQLSDSDVQRAVRDNTWSNPFRFSASDVEWSAILSRCAQLGILYHTSYGYYVVNYAIGARYKGGNIIYVRIEDDYV